MFASLAKWKTKSIRKLYLLPQHFEQTSLTPQIFLTQTRVRNDKVRRAERM